MVLITGALIVPCYADKVPSTCPKGHKALISGKGNLSVRGSKKLICEECDIEYIYALDLRMPSFWTSISSSSLSEHASKSSFRLCNELKLPSVEIKEESYCTLLYSEYLHTNSIWVLEDVSALSTGDVFSVASTIIRHLEMKGVRYKFVIIGEAWDANSRDRHNEYYPKMAETPWNVKCLIGGALQAGKSFIITVRYNHNQLVFTHIVIGKDVALKCYIDSLWNLLKKAEIKSFVDVIFSEVMNNKKVQEENLLSL